LACLFAAQARNRIVHCELKPRIDVSVQDDEEMLSQVIIRLMASVVNTEVDVGFPSTAKYELRMTGTDTFPLVDELLSGRRNHFLFLDDGRTLGTITKHSQNYYYSPSPSYFNCLDIENAELMSGH
jgi:hypothetical protein